MIEDIKELSTLIIPDTHSRDFWREPVKRALEESDAKIVFLGDYVDPYPYEWDGIEIDCVDKGIHDLKEIIELKKNNTDRIILLLGNHDCGYAVSPRVCSVRQSTNRYAEIASLFKDNQDLFQLAYKEVVNGKHIIYSHAGIHKKYVEDWFGTDEITKDNVVDFFNEGWKEQKENVLLSLRAYDCYRGYGGWNYGSIVWADIRSWIANNDAEDEDYGYMVVGHTQLQSAPIITDTFADLDVRRAFYLSKKGEINEF